MNANGILDLADTATESREVGVEVVDSPLAVAAKRETIRKVTSTVLAKVKGVLAVMRKIGVTATHLHRQQSGSGSGEVQAIEARLLWHDHLRKRHPVEDGTLGPLVVECDVVEDKTFPVVEADVELPILPLHLTPRATDIEGDALRLGDLEGL